MENLPTYQPQIQPITCPRCGSRELAFVTEYHKALFAKALSVVLILCIVFTFLFQDFENIFYIIDNSKKNSPNILPYIIYIIFLAFIKIFEYITESRTHIQVICKDCGNQWLFN